MTTKKSELAVVRRPITAAEWRAWSREAQRDFVLEMGLSGGSNTQDCAASINVCMLRVASLKLDGSFDRTGVGTIYTTDQMIKLSFQPDLNAGDDFEQKNGCGVPYVLWKDCDRLKRMVMQLDIATPDPELTQMLMGGTVLTKGTNTRGYMYPRVNAAVCSPYVSVEAWSRATLNGAPVAALPFWRWVFPRVEWWVASRELGNAIMVSQFNGFGIENPNWYNGPNDDWFAISDQQVVSACAYARDTALPTAVCGSTLRSAS